jgi:hypothetical protein
MTFLSDLREGWGRTCRTLYRETQPIFPKPRLPAESSFDLRILGSQQTRSKIVARL